MKSLFSLVALMLLLNVATADVRTWTSRDGKTRFEAEIVGLAKDTDRVIMRKPDGTLLRVAIGFFSFDVSTQQLAAAAAAWRMWWASEGAEGARRRCDWK